MLTEGDGVHADDKGVCGQVRYGIKGAGEPLVQRIAEYCRTSSNE
jgi:hypothetical protein